MDKTQWWYEIEGQQHGPVKKEYMVTLIKKGYLRSDNLVWQEDFPNWLLLKNTELNLIKKDADSSKEKQPSFRKKAFQILLASILIIICIVAKEKIIQMMNKGKSNGDTDTVKNNAPEQVKNAPLYNGQWKTFNHQYHYAIDLPDHFTEGALTNSGIQYYDDSDYDKDFSLTVESLGDDTNALQTLKKLYAGDAVAHKNIYMKFGDGWYVVSGTDHNMVYYKKAIAGKNIDILTIEYSLSDTNLFNTIVNRISKSFRLTN